MRSREALLLVAHGSSHYPDAASALLRHVTALRGEAPGLEIELGLLNGTPSVTDALGRIRAKTVAVVPLFMESGYFTNVAIPRALGQNPRIRMCPPVGLHPAMADIIAAQGRAGCAAIGLRPIDTAVLIVGHGSATAPGRSLALHDHGRELARRPAFGRVSVACLEEAPFLPDALRELAVWPVIVVGFFAGAGMHVRDDVPAAVAAERQVRGSAGQPVRFHACVGDDPLLPEIIWAQAGIQFQERESGRCSHL